MTSLAKQPLKKGSPNMNKKLIERERFMQLELTKNRAQAKGLDAICKEFESQLDAMQSEGMGTNEQSESFKQIGAEFSKLQEILDEDRKSVG